MTSDELFEKAAQAGISKYELGHALYGSKRFRNIYRFKIPSEQQQMELNHVNCVIDRLITIRGLKGKKNGKDA